MKDVRQKSADPAVNQLLIKAYRQRDTLIWDRLDAMQPQCGFGRLAICCTDCYEGPCRVNPFDPLEQATLCGRDKGDLAAGSLLRRVQDGAAALLQLAAARGAELDKSMPSVACFTADVMSTKADLAPTLADAGQRILAVLAALARTRPPAAAAPVITEANMGTLRADAANIVLLGHVHPEYIARLRARIAAEPEPLTLSGVCGNEGYGTARLPLLTTYDAQELPLLTGAVDLLVVGNQCVMPATLRLAAGLGVPVMHAATALDDDAADQCVRNALAHRQTRGSQVDIPAYVEAVHTGLNPANSPECFAAIAEAARTGAVRGLVCLGGCGNIKHTQDADLLALARNLLRAGYLLAATGCTATALAKYGLCRPGAGIALCEGLPAEAPPVLHLGSCHDAQAVTDLVAALPDLPTVIIMPELAHSKSLAVAVALAASGLPTYVSAAALPGLSAADTGNLLQPVEDFTLMAELLAASRGEG